MKDDKYLVYCHIHKGTNKAYVGITKRSATQRWNSGKGYERQAFYKSIQEYGWDSFEHIILMENLSLEEAEYFETFYIDYYDSCENGFNADLASGPIDAICGEYYRENFIVPNPVILLQLYREEGTVDIEFINDINELIEAHKSPSKP